MDRPMNAITLTPQYHVDFSDFNLSFEQLEAPLHSYKTNYVNPRRQAIRLPVTRTLYTTFDKSVDPASPQLSAIYHAITGILHLSAAGPYIDQLIHDDKDMGRCRGARPLHQKPCTAGG
ncbi:hypothetical protein BDW62DRAFT_67184 [Aspergillus aurantiobrunneus]